MENNRPFAFLDIETTGRHPGIHEILEIGVVITNSDMSEMLDSFELKTRPERIEDAEQEALAINHWSEEAWRDAMPLVQALNIFGEKIKGATPAGWNVSFDRAFLEPAMNRSGAVLDTWGLDYTWYDVKMFFVRWAYLTGQEAIFGPRFSLSSAMRNFGISTDDHHHALPDAMATWKIAKILEDEFTRLKK